MCEIYIYICHIHTHGFGWLCSCAFTPPIAAKLTAVVTVTRIAAHARHEDAEVQEAPGNCLLRLFRRRRCVDGQLEDEDDAVSMTGQWL